MIIEAQARLRLAVPLPKLLRLPSGREVWEILGGATGVAMSNYLEQKLLEHTLRNVAYTSPTTVYAALFTAVADGEAGTVTEVTTSGTAYARQSIAFAAYSGGSVASSAQQTYAVATANYGTVTDMGIYDASTAGNMLLYGALTASKVINNGDQFVFPSGNVTCTFD